MSKNVLIQEGGTGKQATVNKLKTNLAGGGTALWVPEDEVQLTTFYVSENGTFRASDEGYYGYDEVVVTGLGGVTGYDDNGDEVYVTTDDDGMITTEDVPSYIVLDPAPTTTDYPNNADIVFTGMVVKAYKESGELWTDATHPDGIIPLSELSLPVTIAHRGGEQESSSDLVPSLIPSSDNVTLKTVQYRSGGHDRQRTWELSGAEICVRVNDSQKSFNYICAARHKEDSQTTSVMAVTVENLDDGTSSTTYQYHELNNRFTHDGKTVDYATVDVGGQVLIDEVSITEAPAWQRSERGEYAWTMVFGSSTGGATQQVPVQYMRNGDYKMLETSFEIHIEA